MLNGLHIVEVHSITNVFMSTASSPLCFNHKVLNQP